MILNEFDFKNQNLIPCIATLTEDYDINPPSHAVNITYDNMRGKIVPCILENLVCDFWLSTWYNSYALEFR